MKFIKNKCKIRKEIADEIVEIIEENFEKKRIKLPQNVVEERDGQVKFRENFRKELICEIADFISINQRAFIIGKAA